MPGARAALFMIPAWFFLLARPILLELEQEGETGFGWVRDIVGSLFAVLVPVTFGIMARHYNKEWRCGCCSEREKRPMIYKWVESVGTGAGGAFLILAVVYQSTQVGRRRRRRRVHTTNTSTKHTPPSRADARSLEPDEVPARVEHRRDLPAARHYVRLRPREVVPPRTGRCPRGVARDGRAGAPARRPPPPPTSTASTALTPAPPLQNFALVLAIVKFAFPGCQGDEMLLPVYILSLWYIISSAWIVAVLRWVVAPRDKGWPCAQPIEDDALAQLRKDAGGYGAGGTMLVTLRDSNAI